jgi:hypothetical protein
LVRKHQAIAAIGGAAVKSLFRVAAQSKNSTGAIASILHQYEAITARTNGAQEGYVALLKSEDEVYVDLFGSNLDEARHIGSRK